MQIEIPRQAGRQEAKAGKKEKSKQAGKTTPHFDLRKGATSVLSTVTPITETGTSQYLSHITYNISHITRSEAGRQADSGLTMWQEDGSRQVDGSRWAEMGAGKQMGADGRRWEQASRWEQMGADGQRWEQASRWAEMGAGKQMGADGSRQADGRRWEQASRWEQMGAGKQKR